MKHLAETLFYNLRNDLTLFGEKYSFCGLKGGTETEDMDFEELELLHKLGKDIVPVTVKIGGAEARTDIRFCNDIGIEGIAAPMIESEYALKNFISTLKNIIPPVKYEKLFKSINLETIVGYRNIIDIADSPSFGDLNKVTAARSDLSASMNLTPDHPEVTRVSANIIRISRERGKLTGVGGTITKSNFDLIKEEIKPDFINSRHVIVDLNEANTSSGEEIANAMLTFEMDLYHLLSIMKPEKSFYYKNRIEVNRERIGERKVLYSIR
ncbi:MAG: aldolase [Leptospira sp.]|nr:aldolase [Leptospira sp.]